VRHNLIHKNRAVCTSDSTRKHDQEANCSWSHNTSSNCSFSSYPYELCHGYGLW